MGHRHAFNTSQMFETDSNQSWHYTDETYVHFGLAGGTENEYLLSHAEYMSIDPPNFSSSWIPSSRSYRYCPPSHTVEGPNHQANSSGPSRYPYMHSSASGSSSMVPESHGYYTSLSSYSGQTFHGFEGSSVDLPMGNEREAYKRKGPGFSSVDEGGSTSRYVGSSFDRTVPSELRHDKPNIDFHLPTWDYSTFRPVCTGNSFSTSGENSLRNVRSRADLALETNQARNNLSNNPTQQSRSAEHFDQNSDAPVEWNQTVMSAAPHDTTVLNHETNLCVMETGNPSDSRQIGGYDIDFLAHRNTGNPVPQYVQGSYFPRYARTSPNIGWHNSDRNGQARFSNERRRPLSYEEGRASQGIMLADQSAMYGSRSSFDQHRDMRLDIDDMSYEELLALGERIGSVNTGLSEDLIVKCMTEYIYCSSDITEEEGSCAICLEEYKNMDDVGMLKACRHDFHVGCIKKWLSIKNMCPICKICTVADHVKDK